MRRRTSTLTNAIPLLILASPGHRLLSGRYAEMHFTGRTGRTYRIPVASRWTDAGIVIRTDSGWWVDGHPTSAEITRAAAQRIVLCLTVEHDGEQVA